MAAAQPTIPSLKWQSPDEVNELLKKFQREGVNNTIQLLEKVLETQIRKLFDFKTIADQWNTFTNSNISLEKINITIKYENGEIKIGMQPRELLQFICLALEKIGFRHERVLHRKQTNYASFTLVYNNSKEDLLHQEAIFCLINGISPEFLYAVAAANLDHSEERVLNSYKIAKYAEYFNTEINRQIGDPVLSIIQYRKDRKFLEFRERLLKDLEKDKIYLNNIKEFLPIHAKKYFAALATSGANAGPGPNLGAGAGPSAGVGVEEVKRKRDTDNAAAAGAGAGAGAGAAVEVKHNAEETANPFSTMLAFTHSQNSIKTLFERANQDTQTQMIQSLESICSALNAPSGNENAGAGAPPGPEVEIETHTQYTNRVFAKFRQLQNALSLHLMTHPNQLEQARTKSEEMEKTFAGPGMPKPEDRKRQ